MIINIYGSTGSNTPGGKVFWQLRTKYIKAFLEKYQIHRQYEEEVIREHKSRQMFCDWLVKAEILNAKSWEIESRHSHIDIIGGGFDIEEDGLLTRFLLECE